MTDAGSSLQVRGGPYPEERRRVTVLFADLVGSTQLAGALDAEDFRQVLSDFFAAVAREVQRFDGTLDKYVGDAVMVVFGAPVAHEDDPARALHAALAMQEAVVKLNAYLEREGRARLALRIGVNTGDVVSGTLADPAQSTYTVVGEAVNLAQRLQSLALPGEILVGELTRRQALHSFEFDQPRLATVKGRTDPLMVCRLVGVLESSAGVAALRIAPLIGRDAESAALDSLIERLSAGTGGMAAVIGDAGVGKSRLIAETRHRHGSKQLLWTAARSQSIGRTIAYLPFLEMIRSDAGISDDDTEDESWARLERRIRSLFPEDFAEILPYVATFLSLPVPGELAERVRYLDGEAIRRQIFLVSRRYVSRLAQEHPLVLFVEDLHWADHSSVTLLEHLAPLVKTSPLLICVTARPEAANRLSGIRHIVDGAAYVELRLAPLAPQQSGELVTELLGADAVPTELRELILTKAEGNPFFIEEIIRSLVDSGAFIRSGDRASRWTLRAPIEDVSIPGSVQGVIRARIDRLDEDVKQLIKTASVIGRSFHYRVLLAVTGDEAVTDRGLAELERLELIRRRRGPPETQYLFRHVLIQESVYESVLLRRRRELHRAVGQAIESVFAQRPEDFYGVLAYHFARAEDWPKAQDYLFKAADQAGRVAADAEALALYDEAIAAYGRAFGDKWEPLQRATLERKIGEALFRRGEHTSAADYLHRALEHLGQPIPPSTVGVRLAIVRAILRQIGHRLAPAMRPPALASPPDPITAELLRCREALGWIYYYLDTERHLLDSLLELNESESRGNALGIVISSVGIGVGCDFIPLFRLAESYHRRAVALAEATGVPLAIGYAYMGLGYHEQRTGEWADALEHWGKGAAMFREAGDLAKWGATTWGTTWLAQGMGRLEQAKRQSEELVRVGEDSADRQLLGWGRYFLGRYLWQSGDTEGGVRSLQAAIAHFERIPDLPNLIGASGDLGVCMLRLGRRTEAVEILERATRLMRERDVRGFLAHVHVALADAYLSQAEEASGAERDDALREAARAIRLALKRATAERGGLVGAWRVQGTYGWLVGKPRQARRWWSKSLEMGKRVGAPYDLAATALEFGRRTGEREHLELAATRFAELRATLDIERARAYLEVRRGA